MTRDQSFIAAVVFVSFFVLWFLWAAVGDELLCWIEKHPGLAVWVQAIFAIISIWAAFFMSNLNYLKEKHDDLKIHELNAQVEIFQIWSATATTAIYLKNLKKYIPVMNDVTSGFLCFYLDQELVKINFPSSDLAKLIARFDIAFANHLMACICAKVDLEKNIKSRLESDSDESDVNFNNKIFQIIEFMESCSDELSVCIEDFMRRKGYFLRGLTNSDSMPKSIFDLSDEAFGKM